VDRRQAFGQQSPKPDFIVARRPNREPPVNPFAVPADGPNHIPRFALLAEVDFPSYRVEQKLAPGNFGVLVEIMTDAPGQSVDDVCEFGSGRRNSVILIERHHNRLSFFRLTGLANFLSSGRSR
jgi:hypothetical protein